MLTPATTSRRQNWKFCYFLALSVLAHLLPALPFRSTTDHPLLQITAPELVLATLSNPLATTRTRSTAIRPISPSTPDTSVPVAHPGTTESQPAPDATLNHLRSLLQAALDQHFIYPPFARRQGWEGRVDVLVRLNQDGHLNAVRVVRSSGYSVLDEDALLTLQRIGKIPQARSWLQGYSYDIQLPILYRLTEG